jgi:DNA-binding FadR family transcriptional regulator
MIRRSVERLQHITSVQEVASDLKRFLKQLSEISHNVLLAAICRFLVEFQVGLALQVSDGRLAKWSKIVSSLQGDRVRVVEALERRDAVAAQEAVSRYHRNAIEIIS